MLAYDMVNQKLFDAETGLTFADRPYRYSISGRLPDGSAIQDIGQVKAAVQASQEERPVAAMLIGSTVITVTGRFDTLGLQFHQVIRPVAAGLEETIALRNTGSQPVRLEKVEIGFCADLETRPDWRLCAIPFKIQLDGSQHDYPVQELIDGKFKNAVFEDGTRKFMPSLNEEGCLRSEAWAWGLGERGLVVIKYNPEAIELSVACPDRQGAGASLRFGGAGLSLYSEPTGCRSLAPGQEFTFGSTYYFTYNGGLNQAFELYRDFLASRGHGFPTSYNPPVNWNELYDVGWYHSNPEKLKQFYTREALLKEAQKANEVGCELLYLDPGWEVCEGITQWDEARLGTVSSLVDTLREDYGLGLGYRTVLRTYEDHWPHDWLIQHTPVPDSQPGQPIHMGDQLFWEPCLVNPDFWSEKLKRILAISSQGVRFMMVDEFDYRGPCYAPNHGHSVPTDPLDHVMAVYRLCAAIRQACPNLTIECHDPVWPWATSIYVPTYFQQGFGASGSYDENWGFEYMWDCLNDLKSGRALALYYYNLACNVPIYLHITMAADNDACVFFWWVASTVRHVGIGGKHSSRTIEPPEGLPPRDEEKRFSAYKGAMQLYRQLKPYFVRGTFHGISETAHLHTLEGKEGGVLVLFNLTETTQEKSVLVPFDLLNSGIPLRVQSAPADWQTDGLHLHLKMAPMSPMVVQIGDAII